MSEENNDTNTITIAAPPLIVAAPVRPTAETLTEAGFTKAEVTAAEKVGMVETPAAAPKADDKAPVTTDGKPADTKPETAPAVKPAQPSSLPNLDMTPEQEKVFLEAFGAGTPHRALYFRMKNERRGRQAAEQKARDLEARLQALETRPAAEKPLELDENGNAVDPEDKPLTLKALKEMQQQEQAAIEKRQQAQQARQTQLQAAQVEQEEYARTVYQDFDETVTRAKDLIQNLEARVPEPWKQEKAVQLIRALQTAAAQADQLGLDSYNAAHIAYELGQMHPEHGKPITPNGEPAMTGTSKESPKAAGSHVPGTLKRALENTQRRQPSASIPTNGGSRTISVEDVDLKTLNGMTYVERRSFREKHPERYAKLLRG